MAFIPKKIIKKADASVPIQENEQVEEVQIEEPASEDIPEGENITLMDILKDFEVRIANIEAYLFRTSKI